MAMGPSADNWLISYAMKTEFVVQPRDPSRACLGLG